jgi:hypothetical protein
MIGKMAIIAGFSLDLNLKYYWYQPLLPEKIYPNSSGKEYFSNVLMN